MVERGKLDTPDTHVYDLSLSWLATDTPSTHVHDRSLSWLATDTSMRI